MDKISDEIRVVLSRLDGETCKRELYLNGKLVFMQVFDDKYIDENDFISKFASVVFNGVRRAAKLQERLSQTEI